MSYGITAQGFIRKPYAIIILELQEKARLFFGDDIDLSPNSPLGLFVQLMAWSVDRQWQLSEDVFYSVWLQTSEGVNLERVAKLGLLSRKPAQSAIVLLEFYGDPGNLIPAGTLSETSQNVVFATSEDVETDGNGTASVYARCTETGGIGLVAAGSITKIKNPIAGITSVMNNEASTGGRQNETDVELRKRYSESKTVSGSSVDAIAEYVRQIAGVISAEGNENTTNEINMNGLPPRSVEMVVQGGTDVDIANAILQKKPAGIETFGQITTDVMDTQGNIHVIQFSRPESIMIYVTYEITVNSDWSEEYVNNIKQNTVQYIGGTYDAVEYSGLSLGSLISAWKLSAIQNAIGGIVSLTVKFGTSQNPLVSENIQLQVREKSITDAASIEVDII